MYIYNSYDYKVSFTRAICGTGSYMTWWNLFCMRIRFAPCLLSYVGGGLSWTFHVFISLRNWLQLFYLLPVNSTIHWTYLLATGWLTFCQSCVEHQNGKLSICQQLFMISRFKCSLCNVNISLTKKFSY